MASVAGETKNINKAVYTTAGNTYEEWHCSILQAKFPPSRTTTQIRKVPMILKEKKDHDKYYVPKVVSLGPYHYGNPSLESFQDRKPFYTNKLLKTNPDEDEDAQLSESIQSLYNNLAQMVDTLRGYYEDEDDHLSNDEFTWVMLLDGCFILYFIKNIYLHAVTDSLGLKSRDIMFAQQDTFLLENQIPYRVLTEVMKFVPDVDWDLKIKRFVDDNIFVTKMFSYEGKWKNSIRFVPSHPIPGTINHLLELLQTRLAQGSTFDQLPSDWYTVRNVNDLSEVGISFKPSESRSINFIKYRCGFCANLELPPITIYSDTKPMLLNLVAYEMCSDDLEPSWVTSYICLLNSLIDHPEDVKVLRKAGILANHLRSDDEVVQLFNDIGTDLVPNNYAYSRARLEIQQHYDRKRNALIGQLKHQYLKTPWAYVALLVGFVSLFLSSVQAYFTVWGSPSQRDS
uniref:UPF0481 protein At3g47200-like n=1 Tax=Erigeron canadensis TaxID=72917 RepID=UPI001CB97439|nr:UPF0481 protein At3g47200-like [Erigeron canadensis]